MAMATVTSKGQVTIPVKVRRALGIKAGTRVDFVQTGNGRVEMRAKTGSIMDLAGCVPKLDHVVTIEEMNEGIAQAVAAEYLAGLDPKRGEEDENSEAA
jgi:AbrB family looped-hinge helix DNA binding protein